MLAPLQMDGNSSSQPTNHSEKDQRRRPAAGLVHHSGQGNQYRASLYQRLLARGGVVPSMSRKGNCYDNAPVESFFSSLKNELVGHRQFQNQTEARPR